MRTSVMHIVRYFHVKQNLIRLLSSKNFTNYGLVYLDQMLILGLTRSFLIIRICRTKKLFFSD